MLMTSSFLCVTLDLGRKKSTGTEPKVINLMLFHSAHIPKIVVRAINPHCQLDLDNISHNCCP